MRSRAAHNVRAEEIERAAIVIDTPSRRSSHIILKNTVFNRQGGLVDVDGSPDARTAIALSFVAVFYGEAAHDSIGFAALHVKGMVIDGTAAAAVDNGFAGSVYRTDRDIVAAEV